MNIQELKRCLHHESEENAEVKHWTQLQMNADVSPCLPDVD